MTFEQKLRVLLSYGFAVGLRDSRTESDAPGHYTLFENHEHDEEDRLTFVGNNLPDLLDEALNAVSRFSRYDAVVADVLAGGSGILHIDGTGAGPIIR